MRLTVKSCRRTLVIGILLLALLGVGWWALWTFAASQFRSSIDNWIDSGRAGGYTITYDAREMFGFPHHVVLRFANLNWKNAEGISFHADNMDLSSVPWNKETFDARFKGHAEISAPLETVGQALILGGDDGRAHVVLDQQGYWKLTHIALTQAKLGRMPGELFQAEQLEASAERPEKLPKDHSQPGLTLTGKALNLTIPSTMPEPFGEKMTALDVSMRVMGAVPDFRRRESVAAWNNQSGVVEFDKLHMDWGPLKMTAKGTIGFDDDLQPEGAFSSKIGQHDKVLKALMDHGFIAQRQAAMLNSALELFAKPSGPDADIEVPITIQLNGLFLGPVRIFVFPEIDWPKPGMPVTETVPVPAATPADAAPAAPTAVEPVATPSATEPATTPTATAPTPENTSVTESVAPMAPPAPSPSIPTAAPVMAPPLTLAPSN